MASSLGLVVLLTLSLRVDGQSRIDKDIDRDPDQPKSWLDVTNRTALKPWNRPGHSVPAVPRGAFLEKFCRSGIYKAQTTEEKLVENAGWFLIAASLASNGVAVVGGHAFSDGMCRPTQYQYFVFVRGIYAGTLSPVLMSSRTDGALSESQFTEKDRIQATFSRYSDRDSLCCPSHVSEAEFVIRDVNGRPVVLFDKANTKPAR